MATIKVECDQCGSDDYRLLDPKTGEVLCSFCRSRWIVPALIQKTETEKFLEMQAQQPRVIMDNTTETDGRLMDMISGIFNLGGCLNQMVRVILGIIALIVLVIAAIIIFNVLS